MGCEHISGVWDLGQGVELCLCSVKGFPATKKRELSVAK